MPRNAQELRRFLRPLNRTSLIIATVVVQAAVMGTGLVVTFGFARQSMENRTREGFLHDAKQGVGEFADQVQAELKGPIDQQDDARRRIRVVAQRARLASGAYSIVLDNANTVFCLPAAVDDAAMDRLDYSGQSVTLMPTGQPATIGELFPRVPVQGEVELPSGEAYASIVYRPELHAKFLTFHPKSVVDESVQRVMQNLLVLGVLSVVGVVSLTGLGSWALVRRYETILESMNRDLHDEVKRKVRAGLDSRNALIFGLAKLADYRDTDTGKHLERICRYCELLANRLRPRFAEIDDAWIERIRLASSMHDIGKVGIPDLILLKPGALTTAERRLMEQHPLIGADTLVAIRRRLGADELLEMGIQVALYHHERYDGTGYPFGLAGEDIPLCARVVALADVYDALTSARVYKPAMGHLKARDIILKSVGTHFDPAVVEAFDAIHEVFESTRRELQPEATEPEKPILLTAVEKAREAAGGEQSVAQMRVAA